MDGAPARSVAPGHEDDQMLVIEREGHDRPTLHNFGSFGATQVNDAGRVKMWAYYLSLISFRLHIKHSSCVCRMWVYSSSSPKKHSRQNSQRGCTPPSTSSVGTLFCCRRCIEGRWVES